MTAQHLERFAAVGAIACFVGFGLGALRVGRAAKVIPPQPAWLECMMPPVVGSMRVGERRAVAVELANQSDESRRVVGVGRMCGMHACYEGLVGPVTIPPRGTGTVQVEVKATSAGPIQDRVTIYTDTGRLGELDVAFTGRVVAAEDQP